MKQGIKPLGQRIWDETLSKEWKSIDEAILAIGILKTIKEKGNRRAEG